MRALLALVAACLTVACTDTFKEDPGWDNRAASQWCKNMGESDPKFSCNHYDYNRTSWCDVTVKDKIYKIECIHDEGCSLDK